MLEYKKKFNMLIDELKKNQLLFSWRRAILYCMINKYYEELRKILGNLQKYEEMEKELHEIRNKEQEKIYEKRKERKEWSKQIIKEFYKSIEDQDKLEKVDFKIGESIKIDNNNYNKIMGGRYNIGGNYKNSSYGIIIDIENEFYKVKRYSAKLIEPFDYNLKHYIFTEITNNIEFFLKKNSLIANEAFIGGKYSFILTEDH